MSIPRRVVLFIGLFLLVVVAGCSTHKSPHQRKARPIEPKNLESPSEAQKKPWELWGLGRDLTGVSIRNQTIRDGDESVREGNYAAALQRYNAADTGSISPEEKQALVARKAGALLATGKYKDALDTVSGYFTEQGLSADAVDGQFALLLGYGYGALNDIDQSLAWFGRAYSTVSNTPIFSNASELGAHLLVQSIPQGGFDVAYSRWKDDEHFGYLLQQEKAQRSSAEYKGSPIGGGTFWDRQIQDVAPVAVGSTVGEPLSAFTVGVILPLSGSFATLGQVTKNGMDLALEMDPEDRVKIEVRDSAGDIPSAQTAATELARTLKTNVIVGPLLSEPANAVRQVAIQARVPMLSLSKANVFETGENIFRLGATSNSQMDTLLDGCSEKLGMTKFALVYPENNVGLEYANAFKKYISAKGLELLYEGTYVSGDATKLALIEQEIEKLPVEGIFVPDTIEQARNLFSLFPENFRDKVRPLGPATWDDPQALAQSQAVFKGAVFVSPFFLGSSNPLVSKFVERYQQKYGKRPDFLAAQGYDAMKLVIGAARKSLTDGTPFELALKDVDRYDGLTGSMRVDVSGEVQRAYTVVEARSGQLRALGSEVSSGKEDQKQAAQDSESTPGQ